MKSPSQTVEGALVSASPDMHEVRVNAVGAVGGDGQWDAALRRER